MLGLHRIGKRFSNGHEALGGITLDVAEGEILAVVGASGCGKSTLLRLVAGLDAASEGSIRLDGAPLNGPSPKVGVVFQEPRLMPWLKVKDNVAFGLPRRLPAAELMGASEGLGYLLLDGQMVGNAAQILGALVLFALLGKLTDSLVVLLTRRLVRWQDGFVTQE